MLLVIFRWWASETGGRLRRARLGATIQGWATRRISERAAFGARPVRARLFGVPRCASRKKEETEIPKETILNFLRERRQSDHAAQAEQELPDQVDTERYSALLAGLVLTLTSSCNRCPGGLGEKLPSCLGG